MSLSGLKQAVLGRWHAFQMLFRHWTAPGGKSRRWVHSRGLAFTLQCDNHFTRYRCDTYNTKEPETLDWIDRWVQDGDVLFDVGANIGVYSIYAALKHPHLKVVAFEPESSNLHCLRDNVVNNDLGGHLTVYSTALGRRTGLSQIHVQDLTPGAALHTVSRELLQTTREHRPVVWRQGIYEMTLDDFCRESGLEPHCMKIDVDGTEMDILEGGRKTFLSPALRTVIIEFPQDAHEQKLCENFLHEMGLRCVWQDPANRSPNRIWVRDNQKLSEKKSTEVS